MNLHVKSLPAEEVLKDIQKGLSNGIKVDLEENSIADNCSEYIINIPENMGQGTIKGITFPTGFSLYQYDCMFLEDVKINFNISKIQPLKFIFCHEGCIDHSFEQEKEKLPIHVYQNIIVAGNKEDGHNIYFEAKKWVQLTSLEINRPKFKNITMPITSIASPLRSCLYWTIRPLIMSFIIRGITA